MFEEYCLMIFKGRKVSESKSETSSKEIMTGPIWIKLKIIILKINNQITYTHLLDQNLLVQYAVGNQQAHQQI